MIMAFSDSARALEDGEFVVVDCQRVHTWQTCDLGIEHNSSWCRDDLIKMLTAMDGPRGMDWLYITPTALRRTAKVIVDYPRASVVVTVAKAIKRAVGAFGNLWGRRVSNA